MGPLADMDTMEDSFFCLSSRCAARRRRANSRRSQDIFSTAAGTVDRGDRDGEDRRSADPALGIRASGSFFFPTYFPIALNTASLMPYTVPSLPITVGV